MALYSMNFDQDLHIMIPNLVCGGTCPVDVSQRVIKVA